MNRLRTIAIPDSRKLSDAEVADGLALDTGPRPRTWGECEPGREVCPWVGCTWHIGGLDVTAKGSLQLPADRQPWQTFGPACAAVYFEEPHTLDEVGLALGVTRERVRQIQAAAVAKVRRGFKMRNGKRRPPDKELADFMAQALEIIAANGNTKG